MQILHAQSESFASYLKTRVVDLASICSAGFEENEAHLLNA